MNAQILKLGDILEVRSSLADPKSPENSALPHVSPEHIVSGSMQVRWDDVRTCAQDGVTSGKYVFHPGDILYSKIRPYLNKVAPSDRTGMCSADMYALLPDETKISSGFLLHWLNHKEFLSYAASVSGRANIPKINRKSLLEAPISLPPLEEQRRIAGILDQADALRRLRTRALDKFNTLGQAIFHEMFGDPSTNPRDWPVGKIGDLLTEAKYGTSGKANTEKRGLPILRMGNVTYDGRIDLSDLKHIELSNKEFPKYTTLPGDILFNRTNSKELVGKTAVVTQDEPMAIAGYLVRGRANERGDTHYISGYLNSAHGKAVLRNMCKNIVGMANINAKEFQSIPIAIPPVDLQREYAAKLMRLQPEEMRLRTSQEGLNELFASLQHRAFREEL